MKLVTGIAGDEVSLVSLTPDLQGTLAEIYGRLGESPILFKDIYAQVIDITLLFLQGLYKGKQESEKIEELRSTLPENAPNISDIGVLLGYLMQRSGFSIDGGKKAIETMLNETAEQYQKAQDERKEIEERIADLRETIPVLQENIATHTKRIAYVESLQKRCIELGEQVQQLQAQDSQQKEAISSLEQEVSRNLQSAQQFTLAIEKLEPEYQRLISTYEDKMSGPQAQSNALAELENQYEQLSKQIDEISNLISAAIEQKRQIPKESSLMDKLEKMTNLLEGVQAQNIRQYLATINDSIDALSEKNQKIAEERALYLKNFYTIVEKNEINAAYEKSGVSARIIQKFPLKDNFRYYLVRTPVPFVVDGEGLFLYRCEMVEVGGIFHDPIDLFVHNLYIDKVKSNG